MPGRSSFQFDAAQRAPMGKIRVFQQCLIEAACSTSKAAGATKDGIPLPQAW
jgi:hypothetical protein